MRILKLLLICIAALAIVSCASTKKSASKLPKGVTISKEVTIPNDTKVAYYYPKSANKLSISNGPLAIQPDSR